MYPSEVPTTHVPPFLQGNESQIPIRGGWVVDTDDRDDNGREEDIETLVILLK